MKIFYSFFLFFIVISSAAPAQNDTLVHRPKVGLVLSGGGALGFAHIGVLKVIDSLHIPIDYVVGTSFGGLVGALYSIGYRSDSLELLSETTDWNDLFSDKPKRDILPYTEKKYSGRYQLRLGLDGFTPKIPSGAIAGQKISLLFSRLTYNYSEVQNFDSLPIPFRCVAVDLITGKQVIIAHGPLAAAMRATMSIPSAFIPVQFGDSLLIDGGLLNNYPADVLKAMGADIIIGVDVSGNTFDPKDGGELFKVLERATSIPRYQNIESFAKMTDIYIKPNVTDFGITDFDQTSIKIITQRGHSAALKQMNKFTKLRAELNEFPRDLHASPMRRRIPQKQFIHGVQIVGNKNLDFRFIYTLLDVKPGSIFSTDIMEHQINSLYALGYFESITYTLSSVNDTSVNIDINVKEKLFNELNIGFRYDDFYKLVGLVGVRATNVLVSGVLVESELEFSGLTRFWAKLSYPSRSLDLPIYPYIIARLHDIPLNVYFPDEIFSYSERSQAVGIGNGFTLDKSWNVEMELDDETSRLNSNNILNQEGRKNHLRYLTLSTDMDFLDDVFVPRYGVKIGSNFEYSQTNFSSDVNYTRLYLTGEYYATIASLHTIRLKGEYMNVVNSPPLAKYFYIGGPESFVGADYQQIYGTRFFIARWEYRYEYKRDIFLKGIVNSIFDPSSFNVFNPTLREPQFGFGIALMFTSILGNFEITIARGNKSYYNLHDKQMLVHFSAGMKF